MSKLILRNIGKSFGDFQAVNDFSLEMKSGEFVSLLGPSGCGKTTTLRMIAGFMPPSAGTIEMDGQVISSAGAVVPPEKRRMSMIFQSYAIWPNMTVGQNVGFGLEVRKLPRADIERRVDRILEVVQMGALKGRYPAELSGGQQQRVALARAIVVEPARGDAFRDPPPARRVQDHHGLRHARPVRGDGDVGPHRGDEQGPHRAGRSAARALRQAAQPLRR